MAKPRKPRPLRLRTGYTTAWIERDIAAVAGGTAFTDFVSRSPRDMRRLARWCEQAAAWMESKESK